MATITLERRVDGSHGRGRIVAAVLIVMCLSSGPFAALSRWAARIPLALETWPYVLTFWSAAIFGFGLFVIDIVGPARVPSSARPRLPLVYLAAPAALATWTLMSALWTDSPLRTPQQALLMALVLATAIWFGFGLSFREQAVSLFIGLHALTLVSVGAALALESGRFAVDGSWVGVFNNPNSLSPVAGLGILVAIGIWPLVSPPWLRSAVGLCAGADVVAVWKSSSATGALALAGGGLALALVFLGRYFATPNVVRVVGSVLAAATVITIPWSFRLVAGRVGKDGSLTGRIEIWDFVFDSVKGRWATGFGFQSFWDDEQNRRELSERRSATWLPDAAHSSFMETLLFLGAIGLTLILIVVALSVGRTWWAALDSPSWSMAWWAAVATFALLENVTESMIAYHSIFWVLLVAAGFAAVRASAHPLRGVPRRRDERSAA